MLAYTQLYPPQTHMDLTHAAWPVTMVVLSV